MIFIQPEPGEEELCQWSYTQWSKCSVTCGAGEQTRKKFLEWVGSDSVDPRDFGDGDCRGEDIDEKRTCVGPPCSGIRKTTFCTHVPPPH